MLGRWGFEMMRRTEESSYVIDDSDGLSTKAAEGDDTASFCEENPGVTRPLATREMTDAENCWNMRLGPLLLEAVSAEIINMIQEEKRDPETWTGAYVLKKLWESGLAWLSMQRDKM